MKGRQAEDDDDLAADYTKLEALVQQVQGDQVDHVMEELSVLSLENKSQLVRKWARETIVDGLQVHLKLPPITSSSLVPASLQMQYNVVKQQILLLIERPEPILPQVMTKLQQVLVNEVKETALFVELVDCLLRHHIVDDMTPSFEVRVLENQSTLSLQARFQLWQTFPSLWELQMTDWLRHAHLTPLLDMKDIIWAQDAKIFASSYAMHQHLVCLHACQRSMAVYPTYRLLEFVQTLASCLPNRPRRHYASICKLDNVSPSMFWQLAQDTNAIHTASVDFLTQANTEACEFVGIVFAIQCVQTLARIVPFLKAMATALKDGNQLFLWLQQERVQAAEFSSMTAYMLVVWMSTDANCIPMALECLQYLFQLPPPASITKRTYQVNLIGVFLGAVENSPTNSSVRESPAIAAQFSNMLRLMQVDPDVHLSTEWIRHAEDRWRQPKLPDSSSGR
ncbi:unnamed protein product [Aphanomyces euteiches]|uniref:Uncharacterized protein n=1 Tax=Aphanomyces euteiches TaxID=100861 RepID=A0A6G0WT85_9STRA|nr:hypothetical protein Ae201684_012071 [Aphanomyces euteiches]KAH9056132.1 hypothetical protein Ae201684P_021869 [Aphanomyces euteiches]KAH9151103.1 hypothetical protein AeRB84_006212 [Aphanomyces euteiches]